VSRPAPTGADRRRWARILGWFCPAGAEGAEATTALTAPKPVRGRAPTDPSGRRRGHLPTEERGSTAMSVPSTSAARRDPPVTTEPFDGVVALDGPSGTGKSTVARRLAERLGARYLDTGAMYRAATLAVLRSGRDLGDPEAVLDVVERVEIVIATVSDEPSVRLDGELVDAEIRSAAVTAAVSAVSAVPAVRTRLVAAQRELIGAGEGIVVEGRDIGTVVWPSARPKVFLTASPQARAQRRAGELGAQADLAAVAADIDRRDRADSTRLTSPLIRADDAVVLDTTELNVDSVVNRLIDIVTGANQ
jgi:CMP/dCMP kinase